MDAKAYLEQVRKVVAETDSRNEAFKKLGFTQEDKDLLWQVIDEWLGEPCLRLQRAAQSLIKGKPKSKLARLLAVEREFVRKHHNDRDMILYRGVGGKYGVNIFRKAEKMKKSKKPIMVNLRGADSWSDDKCTAEGFGDVIIKAKIPVKYVISCHGVNKQLDELGECEYIVALPKKKLKVPIAALEYDKEIMKERIKAGYYGYEI